MTVQVGERITTRSTGDEPDTLAETEHWTILTTPDISIDSFSDIGRESRWYFANNPLSLPTPPTVIQHKTNQGKFWRA